VGKGLLNSTCFKENNILKYKSLKILKLILFFINYTFILAFRKLLIKNKSLKNIKMILN